MAPSQHLKDEEENHDDNDESQLEIPYAMNFSSSEEDKNDGAGGGDDDDDDDSSHCGSIDSVDRRHREPLRVGDVIEYTPAVFCAGTNQKRAVILGTWPSEKRFPLILDNSDSLRTLL